ncbi:MAG: chromosome segregation protein SMC, partial [Candidatus Methanomethylicota archaeon]
MFTCLNVENFLSLKNINLELNKVNILIGPNASGKSNIVR